MRSKKIDKSRPLVFDIRRFALDDGPGIRTTIFLKGCPLSCTWCHNPESQNPEPEIAFYPERCIGCQECSRVCEKGVILNHPAAGFDREKCICCGACSKACPSLALTGVGEYYPVSELAEAVFADNIFYQTSGGGVTFSGGEPTLYMDYLSKCLAEIKKADLHVCLQTCGFFDLSEFKLKLLEMVDLLFFDLKIADHYDHCRHTGVSNELILDNFQELAAGGKVKIIPRTPLIPAITDTRKNLAKIEEVVKKAGFDQLITLPFNELGWRKKKYTLKKTKYYPDRKT